MGFAKVRNILAKSCWNVSDKIRIIGQLHEAEHIVTQTKVILLRFYLSKSIFLYNIQPQFGVAASFLNSWILICSLYAGTGAFNSSNSWEVDRIYYFVDNRFVIFKTWHTKKIEDKTWHRVLDNCAAGIYTHKVAQQHKFSWCLGRILP